MKVETRWKPGTDLMQVWIRADHATKPQIAYVDPDGRLTFEEVAQGKDVAPTLELQGDVWEALQAKINGILPPSAATERHLQDAIAVRERVLDHFLKGTNDR